MALDLDMLTIAVQAHDEEIRQLRELHDLHTQMIDNIAESVQSLTDAMSELLRVMRASL